MPKFQGSGFLLDLPDDCIDASSNAFVLPEHGGYSPSLTIRFEKADEATNLSDYVDRQLMNSEEK